MTADADLSLSEIMRIRLALSGRLRLDLDRDDVISLLRIIERAERSDDVADGVRVAIANMRAEQEQVLTDTNDSFGLLLLAAFAALATEIVI